MTDDLLQQNNKHNVDLALELVSRKFDRQGRTINAVDTKIGIFLGFVGTILAASIVVLQDHTDLIGLNIFTLGLAGIYITLILLVFASRTMEFLDPPDFPAFYSEEALAKPNIQVRNQAVADTKAAYGVNYAKHEVKAKLYNYAIFCFTVSVFVLFLGILEKKPV